MTAIAMAAIVAREATIIDKLIMHIMMIISTW